jgi:hypothetical protein
MHCKPLAPLRVRVDDDGRSRLRGPGAPLATGSARRTILMMATLAIQITTDLGAEDDVPS